jgi:hypothetical protein
MPTGRNWKKYLLVQSLLNKSCASIPTFGVSVTSHISYSSEFAHFDDYSGYRNWKCIQSPPIAACNDRGLITFRAVCPTQVAGAGQITRVSSNRGFEVNYAQMH